MGFGYPSLLTCHRSTSDLAPSKPSEGRAFCSTATARRLDVKVRFLRGMKDFLGEMDSQGEKRGTIFWFRIWLG